MSLFKEQIMKKLMIMIVLLLAVPASAVLIINNRNVSNPLLLRKLLNDRIGTLDSNVQVLQNATPGINNIGTGNVFYVDSVSGSNGNGTTWALAKTTWDAAIALCEDGNHDVIYVASTHAETLAADVTLDIDDITIIGIGSGTDMPEITYDTTTDEVIIDAQGVTVYNMRFIAGISEVAAAFTLADESDYFTIIGCEFPEPTTNTWEFDKVFQLVTGADNGVIAYNTIVNVDGVAGMTSVIDGAAAAIDSLTVVGNYINVDAGTAALLFSDQADTNLFISGNTILQEDTAQFCIELTSTATGLIADNYYGNLGGAAFLVDPGSCFQQRNTASTAINQAGVGAPLEPGRLYSVTMNMGAAHTDDLFEVTGGPILINSLTFYCTTDVAATNTWTILVDHVDKDIEFTTAVDVAAANDGDRIIFTSANPSVPTILALTDNVGSSNLMSPWFCPIGMIEVNNDNSTQVGVFDVYMTFTPLSEGVNVIPQ